MHFDNVIAFLHIGWPHKWSCQLGLTFFCFVLTHMGEDTGPRVLIQTL